MNYAEEALNYYCLRSVSISDNFRVTLPEINNTDGIAGSASNDRFSLTICGSAQIRGKTARWPNAATARARWCAKAWLAARRRKLLVRRHCGNMRRFIASPAAGDTKRRPGRNSPMSKPRISYVDPATVTDPAMIAEFERCAREGTPRPESQAIRAHVPATFWSFANTWRDVFKNGVAESRSYAASMCRVRCCASSAAINARSRRPSPA